jgi:hypothetical protein
MGENNFSRSTVDVDSWTGKSKNERGQPMRPRFTRHSVNDDSASYKFGMASDPLTVVLEGKQTGQK